MVVMGKCEKEEKYLDYVKSHNLPQRFVLILFLVNQKNRYYNHFPMNLLRNIGISNVMTSHYIVMDIDLHISSRSYLDNHSFR